MQELNEQMTSEEIKAYADSVAKEVMAEKQGDRKSDAEIVASVSSVEEPIAEEKSSESAKADSQSEETGVKSSVPKWINDDVKAEAAAYGIDDSELEEFSSREELNRALRLFDKTALETGRKAMVESTDELSRNEKGQFVKKADAKPESPKEESSKRGRYEVSLSTDLYDDEIVAEFTRMRDHYESRLEVLESYFAEANAKSEEQRFDSFVDKLGHSDLFGKTGEESPEELERRRDLHVAVKAQMIGLEKLGRPAELTEKLVNRVANMVFAEQLGKKQLKQRTQTISRQSQLRQGGSPTKPQPVRDDPREEFDRLYRELERA
jgi:hypothetical protein